MSHCWRGLIFCLLGCVSSWHMSDDFTYAQISTDYYEIASWQKITDEVSPVHIYIEGDGYAFNEHGFPTDNPTPRGTTIRDLAMSDRSANVVYMARPCQFIMSGNCEQSDWTSGRFSEKIINSMAQAVQQVSGKRDIFLIGYSGGAMVSGLIIKSFPDLNVKKWITVAGVLNHSDWTEYFEDTPLAESLSLGALPNIKQTHYVAEFDDVVPIVLTQRVADGENIVIVPNARHDDFGNLKIDFSI